MSEFNFINENRSQIGLKQSRLPLKSSSKIIVNHDDIRFKSTFSKQKDVGQFGKVKGMIEKEARLVKGGGGKHQRL